MHIWRFAIGSLLVLLSVAWFRIAGPDRQLFDKEINHGLGVALDAHLESLVHQGFSGAIQIVVGGETLLYKGYGLADRERGIPNTPSTVFHIGSVTKQFTGAAILKLEEQGKLSVNDRISRFFPNVPPEKAGITIHHLLTHTAGVPSSVVTCSQRLAGEVSRDEFVMLAMNTEFLFLPGQQYDYSNAGYELLGAIIELASGLDYETYLKEYLFRPAGMFDTGYSLETWDQTDRIAVGYTADGERWGTYHELFWGSYGALWCNRASGAMLSTIDDLYRWYTALFQGQILAPLQVTKLFTPYVPEGERSNSFYGYGWAIFATQRGTRMVGHNGSLNDILESDMRMYLEEDVLIIIAGNSGEFRTISAVRQLPAIIFSQ
jgi:CubicO group peptidase (beta-lactamase class C family)